MAADKTETEMIPRVIAKLCVWRDKLHSNLQTAPPLARAPVEVHDIEKYTVIQNTAIPVTILRDILYRYQQQTISINLPIVSLT